MKRRAGSSNGNDQSSRNASASESSNPERSGQNPSEVHQIVPSLSESEIADPNYSYFVIEFASENIVLHVLTCGQYRVYDLLEIHGSLDDDFLLLVNQFLADPGEHLHEDNKLVLRWPSNHVLDLDRLDARWQVQTILESIVGDNSDDGGRYFDAATLQIFQEYVIRTSKLVKHLSVISDQLPPAVFESYKAAIVARNAYRQMIEDVKGDVELGPGAMSILEDEPE